MSIAKEHDAMGHFLLHKLDTIIRQLPPEERSKVHMQDGELHGPDELVRKVKELARKDDKKGSAGD